jgi:acetolactate synthase-1/2/3 large subunit
VVLDCLAPWWPDKHPLPKDAKVIHIGPDPIFSRFPVRNFRSDLSIAGENHLTVPALIDAMARLPRDETALAARRQKLAAASQARRDKQRAAALESAAHGITKAFVSLRLGDVLSGLKASVFSELGTILGTLKREEHRSWFQEPHSGGLGWSFPAALGAQLADPDRVCVATLGDGSYMFANPTVCHQIAEALELPVLVVVLNNAEWGAVRASVKGLYPEGYAARANGMPLTALQPSPDFTLIAAASRAWAKSVSDPAELDAAIAEALRVVREDRRCALLDVKVLPD